MDLIMYSTVNQYHTNIVTCVQDATKAVNLGLRDNSNAAAVKRQRYEEKRKKMRKPQSVNIEDYIGIAFANGLSEETIETLLITQFPSSFPNSNEAQKAMKAYLEAYS